MSSKYAVSRLVARDISRTNFAARRVQLLGWIEAQADESTASDALLGAMGSSKDVDRLLVEAGRIYLEAVAANEEPDDGGGAPVDLTPVTDRLDAIEAALPTDLTADVAAALSGLGAVTLWAGEDLILNADFANGALPAVTGVTYSGSDAYSVVDMATTGGGTQPPYAKALRLHPTTGNSVFNISPTTLPAASGRTLSRVEFWWSFVPGAAGSSQPPSYTFAQAFTTKATGTPTPNSAQLLWAKTGWDVPAPDRGSQDIGLSAYASGAGTYLYLAGVRLYAVNTKTYKSGDVVYFNGGAYRSLVNNNAARPGADPTKWQLT